MRTGVLRVLPALIITAASLVSSNIITSQYKTYSSSVYAGDTNTCTDSTILQSEVDRGQIITKYLPVIVKLRG